ncbi:GvpL/GvpF family gas vesicle protein [Geodermatophilus sp. SYSU D00703]
MVLVHGVLRDRDTAVLSSLPEEGLRPRAVSDGSVAAVVTDDDDRELTPEDAVAHLDLLVALVADVPVLPLALGTAAPDDDAVRAEVLEPGSEQFAEQLAAVADLVELRLDLAFDTDATVTRVAESDPELLRLAERSRAPGAGLAERMALGEAVAGRVADLQAELAEAWTQDLEEVAERSAVLHTDEQIRRSAYLVHRDRLADADAAVAELRTAAEGLAAIEYVGPLPVYSFLDEISAEAEPAPTSRWGW